MLVLRGITLLAAASAAAVLLPASANAALTINILQSGSNVVATTSGNIGAGTVVSTNITQWGFVHPNDATIVFAPALPAQFSGPADLFTAMGPSTWGSGVLTNATSSSGDVMGLINSNIFFVPSGYVLGSNLSATDTFAGQTLASLGLSPGIYVYGILDAEGGPVDTVTVNIQGGPGGVPEPATWMMMLLGFAGTGFAMRRRKVAAAVLTA